MSTSYRRRRDDDDDDDDAKNDEAVAAVGNGDSLCATAKDKRTCTERARERASEDAHDDTDDPMFARKESLTIYTSVAAQNIVEWLARRDFTTKYRHVAFHAPCDDGRIGIVHTQLRRSDVRRDPRNATLSQLDIVQVATPEAFRRQGVFLRVCEWLASCARHAGRTLLLELAISATIIATLSGWRHHARWLPCPNAPSCYVFLDAEGDHACAEWNARARAFAVEDADLFLRMAHPGDSFEGDARAPFWVWRRRGAGNRVVVHDATLDAYTQARTVLRPGDFNAPFSQYATEGVGDTYALKNSVRDLGARVAILALCRA